MEKILNSLYPVKLPQYSDELPAHGLEHADVLLIARRDVSNVLRQQHTLLLKINYPITTKKK